MSARIAAIYRYPVKGLSAERLDSAELVPGQMLAHDRIYALAHGSTIFDPEHPTWLPKDRFLMLRKNERLAALATRFDPKEGVLTVERNGRQVARGKLADAAGRAVIEQFFAAYMGEAVRGRPRIVAAEGHNFSDMPPKVISIINLASVKDIERVAGVPVHPLRFRANLYLEGLAPWIEFDWIGREIALGPARLKIVKRIQRCAATAVNPDTAARDLNVVQTLQRGFGHVDCGIYGEVRAGGTVKTGDSLVPPA